ncbi:hypothetical protein FRC03_010173 [Tulasnella sp. 419]|nr:hypothetical protein FRC03_010173 [Tulasnella sp. 419]
MHTPSPLFVPELLSLVLEYCTPSSQVAAAQVCSAWKETALNFIWGRKLNIFELVQTLMPLTSVEEEPLPGEGVFGDTLWAPSKGIGDISIDEWIHFTSYAKRVKSLEICTTLGMARLHHHVLPMIHALHTLHGGPALFPNLRSIYFDVSPNEQSHAALLCPLFYSRSLQSITLKAWHELEELPRMQDTMLAVLSLLRAGSPGVKEIIWRSSQLRLPADQIQAVAQQLLNMGNLEIVRISGLNIPPPLLSALSRTPRLRTLGMECRGDVDSDWIEGSFASLESLELTLVTTNANRPASIVSRLPVQSLKHFSAVMSVVRTEGLLALTAALAARCPLLHSTSFCFNTAAITFLHLQPLTELSHLTDIELGYHGVHRGPVDLAFTNEELHAFTRALPRLRSFQVHVQPPGFTVAQPIQRPHLPAPTLDISCLNSFGAHCPALSRLMIRVDASGDLPSIDEMTELRQLRHLTLTHSRICSIIIPGYPENEISPGRTMEVARLLAKVCPANATFECPHYSLPSESTQWGEVRGALRVLLYQKSCSSS